MTPRYQQLNQTMSAEVAANQMQITRLQNAIKVTVNNELMFPSGDWDMTTAAQQTLSKIVPILAPKQQAKLLVNGYTDNVPIGPGLMSQGITSNQMLSQKRADTVMQFLIAQGINRIWYPRRGSAVRPFRWRRTTRRRAGRRIGAWS